MATSDATSPSDSADVTVVIPAYNRCKLIAAALASVQAQTLPVREIIVIDDHSTDDTVAVAQSLGATVLQTPTNSGSGPARNAGITAATTRWIAFLDSDDTWSPDHVEKLLAHSAGHVLVASAGVVSDGKIVGNPFDEPLALTSRRVLETSEIVLTSACLADREALVAAGLFRPLRRAQDLDMWVRLLQQGSGIALGDLTVRYELHDEQASLDTDLMMSCFEQIVASCAEQSWFRVKKDTVRVYARIHWDLLRQAQHAHDLPGMGRHAMWFAGHPGAVAPLRQLLRLRQQRRRASQLLAQEASDRTMRSPV